MLGKATLVSGLLVDPFPARVEQRASTSGARQRSPVPATGGGGSAASAGTPEQIASRPQVDPRAVPLGQSSGGVSVPRTRRSSMGKRSMSARSE